MNACYTEALQSCKKVMPAAYYLLYSVVSEVALRFVVVCVSDMIFNLRVSTICVSVEHEQLCCELFCMLVRRLSR